MLLDPVLTSATSQGNTHHGEGSPGWVCVCHLEGRSFPRHVHVYRDCALIVKWDLDNNQPMIGTASRRIRALIEKLEAEGAL